MQKPLFSTGVQTNGQSAMAVKQVYPYNFVVGDIIRKALHKRKNIYCYISFSSLFFFCFHYDSVRFFCQYSCVHLKFLDINISYIDVVSVTLSISISYNSYYLFVHKSYYKCLKSVNSH